MNVLIYAFGAGILTVSCSLLAGNAVLRISGVKLRRDEALYLAFILGSGLLAAVVFALAAVGGARRGTLMAATFMLIGVATWRRAYQFPERSASRLHWGWRFAFWSCYGLFAWIYLSVALAPAAILDGTYLADALRMAREFGFNGRQLPDPSRLLVLYTLAIGHREASQIIPLLFLLTTPFGIRACGERLGRPRAGALAAMLFFASPIIGRVGTIVAPDLMIAAIAVALFLAVEARLRVAGLLLFGYLAAIMTPWVLEEFAKPVLHYKSWYGFLPLDLTIQGNHVGGLLGPVFLLAPLALLSLRNAAGRRVVAFALFFCSVSLGAMEARAFVPGLPFLSLALAMTIAEWPGIGLFTLAAHAVFSWPGVTGLYVEGDPWRIHQAEWPAALRTETEPDYLMRASDGYEITWVLEHSVDSKDRVLAITPLPAVYHTRMMVTDRTLSDRLRRETPDPELLRRAGIQWVVLRHDDSLNFRLLSKLDAWNLEIRAKTLGWTLLKVPQGTDRIN